MECPLFALYWLFAVLDLVINYYGSCFAVVIFSVNYGNFVLK